MTADERLSSGWKPGTIVFVIVLLVAPLLLLSLESIIEWRARSFAARILEKLGSIPHVDNSTSNENISQPGGDSSAPSCSSSSSCLSRCQQELFRKPMESQAPEALKSALAGYERMHSRCYERQNLSRAITNPDPDDPCKYLVFLQDGRFGLGNHILSLLSAFIYALLTNRMLLVDSRGHLSKLLCEPFTNSSWLLPPDFPYHRLLLAPFLDSELESKLKYVNAVHLMLLSEQTEGEQQFFCPRTQLLLDRVPWLGWSSNQYYIPRFLTLPSFWRPLTGLFPDVSAISTQLSRYLVLPQNHIWEKLTRFHSSYLASTPGRILGVQIRTRGDRASFDAAVYSRVMECVVRNNLLPEAGRAGPGDSTITQSQLRNTTKAFVASLEGRFYEELKRTYMSRATVDGSLVQVHTMSHDQVESQAFEQAADALAEIWILSFSNDLVTSSWSTFGYIAQALAGARPYILNINGVFEEDDLPACSRGNSPEPCNHFPFASVCKLNETENPEQSDWIKHHIHSCQDEAGGIQLVNS